MLRSDPLLSLWTSYGRWGAREEMGAGVQLPPQGRAWSLPEAGSKSLERLPAGAANCCLSPPLTLPALALFSPTLHRWARLSGLVDSAICAGARRAGQ